LSGPAIWKHVSTQQIGQIECLGGIKVKVNKINSAIWIQLGGRHPLQPFYHTLWECGHSKLENEAYYDEPYWASRRQSHLQTWV